jgi:predicted cupin superfamily sugar epimerase
MAHEHALAHDAALVVERLGLQPHPEGGWYAETFRDVATDASGRARSTAIFYLLGAGDVSARHRVDAVEVWHHYAGDALELTIEDERHVLGDDLAAGEHPQVVVPAGAWQSARPLGEWALVGCTVAPGFEFVGFELADG